jgi:hypothetical protein
MLCVVRRPHVAGSSIKETPMSIGGIGASGATNPLLSSLLSFTNTSAASPADDGDFSPDAASAPNNALTGTTQNPLSSNVLDMLMGTQQAQTGKAHRGGHHHHGASGGGADQLLQALDSDDSANTVDQDFLTQGDSTANPADILSAIQKYQTGATGGSTQATV